MKTTNLYLIIEKSDDGHYWGRIEDKGFMPTGQGKTIPDLIENVKDSIKDYVEHEGRNDKFWKAIDLNTVKFQLYYDLEAFFETFDDLKKNVIARNAGINESLLRQYISGQKNPSENQVKKIEKAVHQLGSRLMQVNLV